ncbi:hypothetical protein GCM10010435_44070 [Winogradskya consettensis]|uniref:Uncharacterized protein n=1 Tax=Winogradskya consettensis TaxID=113560 RepID=A0A919SZX7_9ACTN|nr:hypothetical protein [Actinoplanes consettensis]GIM82627.1 hypothetical protein Aco04nite_82460 [Actinoplanes consettensis]
MTSSLAPRLPRELFATGVQVVTIAPLGPGVVAHRYATETRQVQDDVYRARPSGRTEIYPVAACAEADADQGYPCSLQWAAVHGAIACTEPKCFPEAVSA